MSVNPYAIAFIAVAGTILGALLSSLTQLATMALNRKSERLKLQTTLEHATTERLATERRAVYARFLVAAQTQNLLNLRIFSKKGRGDDDEISSTMSELRIAAREAALLAEHELSDGISAMLNRLTQELHQALAKENPDDPNHERGGITMAKVENMMQAELGIKNRHLIDDRGLIVRQVAKS
ncbi:hypothetical protein [Kribbella sp. CA-293567]|uniref:hypothetical protein n=1 Tax=Kribbella sp. CA-293567 TaxID=3002436 RepID=UPI0022DD1BAB|nr:hypothetical protein [Kribbella sp. CA-293567]WBQ06823.1 hypothetical protein OX958_08515 [Kribbella sp. CA-293567]